MVCAEVLLAVLPPYVFGDTGASGPQRVAALLSLFLHRVASYCVGPCRSLPPFGWPSTEMLRAPEFAGINCCLSHLGPRRHRLTLRSLRFRYIPSPCFCHLLDGQARSAARVPEPANEDCWHQLLPAVFGSAVFFAASLLPLRGSSLFLLFFLTFIGVLSGGPNYATAPPMASAVRLGC